MAAADMIATVDETTMKEISAGYASASTLKTISVEWFR
jgi:hypothetical protein